MRILLLTGLAPLLDNRIAGAAVVDRLRHYRNFCEVRAVSPVNIISSDILGRFSQRFSRYPPKELLLEDDLAIEYPRYFLVPRDKPIERIVRTISMRLRPNLIITHWGPTGWGASSAATKMGIPHVQFFHGSDIHDLRFKNHRSHEKTRSLIQASDICFFVSDGLKKLSESKYGAARNSFVSPNGINTEIFRVLPEQRQRKPGVTIGYIGRFEPIKGVDNLPGVFDRIRKARNDIPIKFVLVGEGSLRKSVERQLQSSGISHVSIGFVDQKRLAEVMNDLDVLLVPSRNEGWGSVILESIACGTPVVATKVGGTPEAIGNSYNGILVEPGNSFLDRFAQAAIELLENPREPEILAQYASQFSWANIVGREMRIMKETLAID
ncbi:glycosyltransferase [Mesotoga sp. UBA5825]|uniref:glycosyltransferase n=1 Tax=Mesotoga sp. UBA5825 TaxID=1946858 RepID=UPI000AFC7B0D|nr:glycosyltransferase [Mesotoga sp. UBA5825]